MGKWIGVLRNIRLPIKSKLAPLVRRIVLIFANDNYTLKHKNGATARIIYLHNVLGSAQYKCGHFPCGRPDGLCR